MNDTIKNLKQRYSDINTIIKETKNQIIENKASLEENKQKREDYFKARIIFNEVTNQTQNTFKKKVEGLITMAIQSVFDRPFKFKLKFEEKAGRSSCTPIVVEDDLEYIPKEDLGGGVIDIISAAFRFVLWSIQNPRSRNFFVLDEPMKFVGKGELLLRAGNMLREISHRLNIQLLIITHEPELAQIADTAYKISHDGKKSIVEKIK